MTYTFWTAPAYKWLNSLIAKSPNTTDTTIIVLVVGEEGAVREIQ